VHVDPARHREQADSPPPTVLDVARDPGGVYVHRGRAIGRRRLRGEAQEVIDGPDRRVCGHFSRVFTTSPSR
jgi:hypothetical protein